MKLPDTCESATQLSAGSRKVVPVASESPPAYLLDPAVGKWRIPFRRLARSLASTEGPTPLVAAELTRLSADASEASLDRFRYMFTLSFMSDLLASGGDLKVIESQVWASWPDWHGPNGREFARAALEQAREPRQPLSAVDEARFSKCFMPSATVGNVRGFLEHADFWLESADSIHPTGIRYGELFNVALNLWNMPYRGRTGRTRRFVVVGKTPDGKGPFVIGLIEVGDDTPFNSERDVLLGLGADAFLSWAAYNPSRLEALEARFRRLRSSVLPVEGIDLHGGATLLLKKDEQYVALAGGRSQESTGFMEKKRIAYAVRLAQGERAMALLRQGRQPDERWLRSGLRAIKDLTIPRVAMEVTICGAVPPFSSLLGGKLVVAFLGHPDVISACRGTAGTITSQVFQQDRLEALMPDHGLLAVTTKGLYPNHSALYNRADLATSGPARLRLKKIGETRGATTTLISPRTSRLAQKVLDAEDRDRVSMTYGTGGAKRHRRIEAAISSCGLPQSLVHAGIRRPVYGTVFAANVPEVIWGLDEPQWLTFAGDSSAYSQAATHMWLDRWSQTIEARYPNTRTRIDGTLDVLRHGGVDEQSA